MKLTVRPLTDISRLMTWRREVIREVFGVEPSEALLEANRRYYETHVADGSHVAFVADADGVEAGCGAICLTDELPSPDNPSGRCAYLMNIYVRPDFRGRGVATAIVNRLVETARLRGCDKIYLETTAAARALYNRTGFKNLPGIMKYADTKD